MPAGKRLEAREISKQKPRRSGASACKTWMGITPLPGARARYDGHLGRQAAALGDGAIPDEYAETHKLKFRADSLRRKGLHADHLAVIYGRGDSMAPTINDGDAILFDRNDTRPQDGKLFVITYDGELYAKRLMELDGAWYARSDNDSDPKWRKPKRLDPSKGLEIAGRIRWVAGWVD